MVTLTSTYNTNPSQTFPFEKHQVFSSPKISSNNQDEHHYSGRKKEEDGEIGVFGAEKYFNGGTDHVDSPRKTKTDAKKLDFVKPEGIISLEPIIKPVITTHQGTASSVRSESSWNSQTALLQSTVMRNPNPPLQKPSNKVNGKSFLSSLAGCKCYCSDRSSVDIEEVVQVGEISFKRPPNGGKQNKTSGSTTKACVEVNKPSAEPWIKEELFTFPTMNSTVGLRPVKVPISQGDADEIGRKSLEVFGSPVVGRRNKSLNLEGRFKMLSWDATPKVVEEAFDAESDASSDLFEIESLTGKGAANNPFLGRQASDAAASGCVTPTTCYAPSEASIEWSVVTASAADLDYEDTRPSISLPSPMKTFSAISTNVKTKHNNKEFQRRGSGGLLGCNSQKAVKVAGDAYKTNDKAGFDPRLRRVSDSYMPAARFQADQTKQTPRILPTRSLAH